MAKVTPSASPSETSAAAFQTQDLSEPTFGESFISGTTAILLEHWTKPKRDFELTIVVGADLEGLVAAHNKAGLSVLLVLQESDISSTALLPLVGLTNKLEELGAHLEGLLLNLLSGLDVNLLGKADDWLKVNILGLWCLILQLSRQYVRSVPGGTSLLYLWVGLLLGLSRSRVVSTVLILDLLLLGSSTEHGEDAVPHGAGGGGDSVGSNGGGLSGGLNNRLLGRK